MPRYPFSPLRSSGNIALILRSAQKCPVYPQAGDLYGASQQCKETMRYGFDSWLNPGRNWTQLTAKRFSFWRRHFWRRLFSTDTHEKHNPSAEITTRSRGRATVRSVYNIFERNASLPPETLAFLPPSGCRFTRDLRSFFGGKLFRSRVATLESTAPTESRGGTIRFVNRVFHLASGDPADHDGRADHVGGALLAFRTSGHGAKDRAATAAGQRPSREAKIQTETLPDKMRAPAHPISPSPPVNCGQNFCDTEMNQ
jgi:hypothetical protein